MKKYGSREKLWLIKLIASLLILIFTVRFAVPISTVVSTGCVYLLSVITAPQYKKTENMSFSGETVTKTEENTTGTDEKTTIAAEESTTGNATELKESVYETPADILKLEEDYLAVFSEAEAYGSTEEVFFKTSGATDTVQGISIKNATATKKPDFEALLNAGPVLDISYKSAPLVLIFHTHTTESYLLSDNGVFYEDFETRSTDNSKNMVRVGDEICRVLEENGIGFIHDTSIYDESYEGAYARSRVTVEEYLEQYPTIQIVLDVHRDAIYYSDTSRCKPTAEIDGRKAAQIMIITGAQEGYITDFPYWEDNLKFALCFQKTAEEKYPGLMKPIYFCQRKYNMDTAKCSLLLEMGTDANTLDEAMYSGYLTGMVLTDIINSYSGE